MSDQTGEATTPSKGAPSRIDAVGEWRSKLTSLTGALILFEIISGLVVFLFPFGAFPQFSLIAHTVIGLAMVIPVSWYGVRHWWVRRKGNLSHYQLLGYIAAVLLGLCLLSGVVVTWNGIAGPRLAYVWDILHLVTGMAVVVFIVVHLLTVISRKVNKADARKKLKSARRVFYGGTLTGCAVLFVVCGLWSVMYRHPGTNSTFPDSYNWAFGEDRPFAPSLARLDHSQWERDVRDGVLDILPDTVRPALVAALDADEAVPIGMFARVRRCLDEEQVDTNTRKNVEAVLASAAVSMRQNGALDASLLGGSAGCGTSGCHTEIYQEWLPSAHRYSSMDDMFQRVQTLMAEETSPEHTRYCAGCHDPISLFSGAKNSGNVTLSTEGADEGTSCVVCHSIVQADVQGNGDYTVRPPVRYAYELNEGPVAKFVSDFLIRTYPEAHIKTYARPLYKTAEFCGACHKQYLDTEVNTDIGKVQGQNQYDSWKNSRWYHENNPQRTVSCRECHMPLNDGNDPAWGDVTDYNRSDDDRKHRSHRMLGANQYIPLVHNLEGAQEHVELTEKWLRGEIEIPEIDDKWTTGPVVRMHIVAPETVSAGDEVPLRVTLTNNKTGHDFPTGPLDMLESWIELTVTDDAGNVVYTVGGLDETGEIVDSPVLLKAIDFDRKGELIDRHNLWDMVGASYKRSIYPGVTDTVQVKFQCPSMARGRVTDPATRSKPGQRQDDFAFTTPESMPTLSLTVDAVLWYRKANPEFLDRVYGAEAAVRSPVTQISSATMTIKVLDDGAQGTE